ncbi:MAG: FKBP-type peptidyl-prolyl cis-trans isomerase [Gammaproteobacteria bacterium]|nr:FKBP-type peptidyl-prolyl cis-trans isomerase [Gammaproteobacteria bacterium]MDH3412919.1 FKBP-type peptidyl-prolyl cis-trans isomerase [Gammaproteobacteria bacterium]
MKSTMFRSLIPLAAFATLLLNVGVLAETGADKSAKISEGSKVAIEFTIFLKDGSVFGGNEGGDPLVYEQGKGEIPSGLETALVGLKVDERKKVTLTPEEAYGPVNPAAFVDVERDRIPEDARSVGAVLMVNDPNGNRRFVRVHEVKADTVIIDLNHPLAGKQVTFDVHVLTVE